MVAQQCALGLAMTITLTKKKPQSGAVSVLGLNLKKVWHLLLFVFLRARSHHVGSSATSVVKTIRRNHRE